jgi:hypothetical protein
MKYYSSGGTKKMQNHNNNVFLYYLAPTCFGIVEVFREVTPKFYENIHQKFYIPHAFVVTSAVQIVNKINIYNFFCPMPPHVPYGLHGLPSRLWPKCNRLLRLGRP